MPFASPVQVTFRGFPASSPLRTLAERKAAGLSRFAERITRCHVTIAAPPHHHLHGGAFRVHLELEIPGLGEIEVERAEEDPYAAVHLAFATARRQLVAGQERRRQRVQALP